MPTRETTATAAETTTTSSGLSEEDQAFIEELRAIDGMTIGFADEQLRLQAELRVCGGLRHLDGDWDELMAGLLENSPEIPEQAFNEFARITVEYLCPEFQPPN